MTETAVPELVIEAGKADAHYWRDLWRYRELFAFLAWRDVLVRYKQTVFGVAWAWLRPLLTMLTFTLVFGKLAKLPSNGIPYPVLVFAGLLPWQFFSTSFGSAASSLVDNANLISKVYFPRLIVPTATVIVCLVDTLVAAVLLGLMMIWYGVLPSWHVIALPFFVALAFFAAMGSGLLVAALNVRYRDFRYVIPFIIQFGLYVSPVGFSSSVVPEQWRLLYAVNPMVGVIDGFRWCLLGDDTPLNLLEQGLACFITALMLYVGIRYFRKTEQTFADII